MASSTGNDVLDLDFTSVKAASVGLGWRQFSFDLPEGTRYFAVHHNTPREHLQLLLVDDITYAIGTAPLKGFNIYVNGQVYDFVAADKRSYSLRNILGDVNSIAVSALYDDGRESVPVRANWGDGIINIHNTDKPQSGIYTLDGQRISDEQVGRLKPGVYIIDGCKQVVK